MQKSLGSLGSWHEGGDEKGLEKRQEPDDEVHGMLSFNGLLPFSVFVLFYRLFYLGPLEIHNKTEQKVQ